MRIVTRDLAGFRRSEVPAVSPRAYLAARPEGSVLIVSSSLTLFSLWLRFFRFSSRVC